MTPASHIARIREAFDQHHASALRTNHSGCGCEYCVAVKPLLSESSLGGEWRDRSALLERVAERIIKSPCHLGVREDAYILANNVLEELGL